MKKQMSGRRVKQFQIYRDKRGKYRWRVTAPNGRILAQSSEAYTRKIDCRDGAMVTRTMLQRALVPPF